MNVWGCIRYGPRHRDSQGRFYLFPAVCLWWQITMTLRCPVGQRENAISQMVIFIEGCVLLPFSCLSAKTLI